MIKFQNKIHVYSVCVCVMSMCLREGRKGKWVKDKGIEEKCTTLVNLENQCMVALYNYFAIFICFNSHWNKGNGNLIHSGSGAYHKKQISEYILKVELEGFDNGLASAKDRGTKDDPKIWD